MFYNETVTYKVAVSFARLLQQRTAKHPQIVRLHKFTK